MAELDIAAFLRARLGDQRLPERFWKKVRVNELTGCWLWVASKGRGGYGRFMVADQTSRAAHRVAFEALVGPIGDGLQLDHLCRVRSCVNPSHLEAVTQRINLLRGETLTAKSAAATHCPQGHPYAGDNLYVSPKGFRKCRTCTRSRHAAARTANPDRSRAQARIRDARYRARKKGQTA